MKKILVVDDDSSILEALKIGIESEGHDVLAISEGDEAYSSASEYKPDLILMDLLLSGRDGQDIIKELRSKKETKNIPIVMLSAHPSADKSAIKSGADAFLAKPFEFEELIKTINSF